MRFQNTPSEITELEKNEVIVVGTNTQAIHGVGLAKLAKEKWGLIPGISMGLCNQSYGLITKDLTIFNPNSEDHGEYKNLMKAFIGVQLINLYFFAALRKDLTFYITLIGCGLGGFTIDEIAPLFKSLKSDVPSNVCLPIEFS
jgi:hypothetical protein